MYAYNFPDHIRSCIHSVSLSQSDTQNDCSTCSHHIFVDIVKNGRKNNRRRYISGRDNGFLLLRVKLSRIVRIARLKRGCSIMRMHALFVLFCPALEVIDLHGVLDFGKCLLGFCSGSVSTFCQCRDDFFRMSFEVSSPLSDRCQKLIEYC